MGHKGIKEHEEYKKWKVLRQNRDREIALSRGKQALNEIYNQKLTECKIKENKNNVRKSIAMTERLRAAEIRAGKESLKNINKIRVVEIDAKDKTKKVRFLDKGNILPAGNKETDNIRRIPLSDISTNGVEAAIIEQEREEKKEWEAEKREIEMARIRAEASLRKSREEKENQPPYNHDTDKMVDHSNSAPVRRIIETDCQSKIVDNERVPRIIPSTRSGMQTHRGASIHSDLDRIPVRGPSSTETSTSTPVSSKVSPSTSNNASASPMLDSVISRYPTYNDGRPMMGGPTSAFRNPKMGEVSMPKDKDKTHDTPTQSSPKTNEGDRDFISKVLKDFNFPHDHGVKVKVDVQEVSTINSSLSITQERERTTQGEMTRTTIKSSTSASMSSSSSIDITKEKFLSEQWRQRQIKDQGYEVPGYEQLHSLIGRLESKDHRNAKEVQRQNQLRIYIERLLQMKRKEIDDLSISDVSSLSTTFSSSFKESSTSQIYSSTSSQAGSKRNQESSIQFGDTIVEGFSENRKPRFKPKDVVSSTPTSILSSSDSKSSTNKTVRFATQDKREIIVEETNRINNWLSGQGKELDGIARKGSYDQISKPPSLSSDEIERQRIEILDRTRLSLTQIRNYYEEQRRRIELELETRKLCTDRKRNLEERHIVDPQTNISSPSQLSEGPLSTETDSSNISTGGNDINAQNLQFNSSQKESSLSSNNNGLNMENNKKRKNPTKHKTSSDKPLALDNLNKTGSSGTATSSSNATAELLSRIRRMEIPALVHPPPKFWEEHADQNPNSKTENILQHPNPSIDADSNEHIKEVQHTDDQLQTLKDHQTLAALERKRAAQSLGMDSETFSSFQFSDEGSLEQLSEQYSSISISSEENA